MRHLSSRRLILASILVPCLFQAALAGNKPDQDPTPAEYQQRKSAQGKSDLARAIDSFFERDYDRAAELALLSAGKFPEDPATLGWQAAIAYRQGSRDLAVGFGEAALAIDDCQYVAREVLGDALNPQFGPGGNADRAWRNYLKAVKCNPGTISAWMGIWIESLRRQEAEWEHRAGRAFIENDLFTAAMLGNTRWILRNLPPDAVFLVNGDMDTYPVVALQEVEELRRDVVLVNISLLNLEWYRDLLCEKYDIPLPFSDEEWKQLTYQRGSDGKIITVSQQVILSWQEMVDDGEFSRPIVAALTVSQENLPAGFWKNAQLGGPYHRYLPGVPESSLDGESVEASLADLDPSQLAGSFVSYKDISPVRTSGAQYLAGNPVSLAMRYAEMLKQEGRLEEALKFVDWAEEYLRVVTCPGSDKLFEMIRSMRE